MFQSSVISWSSKIISDGTFASTRRTCGSADLNSPTLSRSVSHDSSLTSGSTSGTSGGFVGNSSSAAGHSTGDHASRYIAMNSP